MWDRDLDRVVFVLTICVCSIYFRSFFLDVLTNLGLFFWWSLLRFDFQTVVRGVKKSYWYRST